MTINTKINTPSDKELLRMCEIAGVTADEVRHDPKHGLLVSASGARKLSMLAEDQARAQAVRNFIADVMRSGFRVVK
jgi:hypothetical protein